MKERTTQALLAIIAALLVAHWFEPQSPLSAGQANELASTPDVVRARAIEVVGNDGKAVVQLFLGEDGGGNLRIRSGDGMVRVKLGASPDGSGLLLFDTEAEPAVQLSSNKAGTSATFAEKGKEKKIIWP